MKIVAIGDIHGRTQKDAPHPGEILVELYLKPLRITKEQISTRLKISEKDVTKLLEGKLELKSALAARLAKMFKTSKEYWLNLQKSYNSTKNNSGTKSAKQ